jgi:hypothetical protein
MIWIRTTYVQYCCTSVIKVLQNVIFQPCLSGVVKHNVLTFPTTQSTIIVGLDPLPISVLKGFENASRDSWEVRHVQWSIESCGSGGSEKD